MTSENRAVIAFAKYPEEGKVKTRLAVTIGSAKALRLYTLFAETIFAELIKLKEIGVDVYLFFADEKKKPLITEWTENSFIYKIQTNTDLGTRMYNAFTEVLQNQYDKALIIGTDVPDLNCGVIKTAFDKLDNHDMVIGPADDGGYYLLGLKQLREDFFTGIEWSTSEVLDKTLAKAKNIGLTTSLLDMLYDIDTEEELYRWLETSGGNNTVKQKAKQILEEDTK